MKQSVLTTLINGAFLVSFLFLVFYSCKQNDSLTREDIIPVNDNNGELLPPNEEDNNEELPPPNEEDNNEELPPPNEEDNNEELPPPNEEESNEELLPPNEEDNNDELSPPNEEDLTPPNNNDHLITDIEPIQNITHTLNTNGFMLSWDYVENAVGYLLDIATDMNFNNIWSNHAVLEITDENTVDAVITNLPSGATYFYRIYALFEGPAIGPYSDTISITLPPNPNDITLKVSSKLLIANGNSEIALYAQLINEDGKLEVNPDGIQFMIDGNATSDITYKTSQAGVHTIRAVYGKKSSNEIKVNAREPLTYDTLTLPVVFHVIHHGQEVGTTENISESNAEELIRLINENYSATNVPPPSDNDMFISEYHNRVDTRIRFRLAKYDLDGNELPERGIMRHRQEIEEYSQGYVIRNNLLLDPNQYINVFMFHFASGGLATPPQNGTTNPLLGLELTTPRPPLSIEVPSVFVGTERERIPSLANLISHELGHFLGLYHPFSDESNCNCDRATHRLCVNGFIDNDWCSDTKTAKSPDAVDIYKKLCNDSNYYVTLIMDNAYLPTRIFTYEQAIRMHHVLTYSPHRKDLKDSKK